MANPATLLGATDAFPLWDTEPITDAFTLAYPDGHVVVTQVLRPWLFRFAPQPSASNGRAVLILAGGGYTQLMIHREGVAIAYWLATLGFTPFVLIHRFPNTRTSPQAPLDDARRALALIQEKTNPPHGIGVCGLSSGGHLAAALLAAYPSSWTPPSPPATSSSSSSPPTAIPHPTFAILAYGPISTNAKGRTIVSDKAPLPPAEKQAFYDAVQPDVHLLDRPPPTFIVYAPNDEVVPVVNAYRIAEALGSKGAKVELDIFADAPHGFGIDTVGLPVGQWPSLCEAWMGQMGLLG